MSEFVRFESKVTDVVQVNPLFSKCKVYVMYYGLNRNGSFISKEVVESALPTLYNIPIVGEFKEEKDDFGSHGGKIIIDDSGFNYVKTTMPYGVVPESATFSWETIRENGVDHEYLVIDGAFLWTGRYDEANKVIEEGKSQSMEVEFTKTTFDNKSKVTNVEEMVFSALCILGDDVEPAFEGAKIGDFSFDKETMRQFVKEMIFELAEHGLLQVNKEGGNGLTVDNKDKSNFSLSSEQLERELRMILGKEDATTDEWGYTMRRYWYVDNKDGIVVATDSNMGGVMVGFEFTQAGDLVSINFDSGKRYKIEYVEMDVNGLPDGDENVTNASDGDDFSLVTKEQMEFEVEKAKKQSQNTTEPTQDFSTSTDNDVNVDNDENAPENPDEEVGDFEMKEEFEKLQADFETLQAQFSALETEATELREFKANTEAEKHASEVEAVFAKFTQLTEEELTPFKEKVSEFSLEELETQLFALVGKKMASGQFSLDTSNSNKVPFIEENPVAQSTASYASIIEKHRNKTK